MRFNHNNWEDCPWDQLQEATLKTSRHVDQAEIIKIFARGKEQVKNGNAEVVVEFAEHPAEPTPKFHAFIHPQTNNFLMIGLIGSHANFPIAPFLNNLMEEKTNAQGYCCYFLPQDLSGFGQLLNDTNFLPDPAAAEEASAFLKRQGEDVSKYLCYSRHTNR